MRGGSFILSKPPVTIARIGTRFLCTRHYLATGKLGTICPQSTHGRRGLEEARHLWNYNICLYASRIKPLRGWLSTAIPAALSKPSSSIVAAPCFAGALSANSHHDSRILLSALPSISQGPPKPELAGIGT